MIGICKLCGNEKKLIRAHIIPTAFFEANNFLISSVKKYAQQRKTGPYDPRILCADCDNGVIGRLDDYGCEIFLERKNVILEKIYNPVQPSQFINKYSLKDKTGYHNLGRFIISILWRASVSLHEDFVDFSLGEYEEFAKRTILDICYDFGSIFSIAVSFLCDLPVKVNSFSSVPTIIKNVNFYIFIIGFYKIFIKFGKEELPIDMKHMILSSKNDLLMIENEFLNIPEFSATSEIVKKTISNKVPKIWTSLSGAMYNKTRRGENE